MIPMQIMIGQLTREPVPFPTRVGRVFIADKETIKFRGSSDAAADAAKRRAREQFGKASATILSMEGEFSRSMLKNQRLVRSGTTTIHHACQELLAEGLIQLVRKHGKNEFYRVMPNEQRTAPRKTQDG